MARSLTDIIKDTTLSYAYRLRAWSIAVRWRDRKCIICGSKEKLQAHHVYDKSYHPGMALDVDNGATLCSDNKKDGNACHKMFHIWFRGSYRMKCTREQFEDFVRIAKQYLATKPS